MFPETNAVRVEEPELARGDESEPVDVVAAADEFWLAERVIELLVEAVFSSDEAGTLVLVADKVDSDAEIQSDDVVDNTERTLGVAAEFDEWDQSGHAGPLLWHGAPYSQQAFALF